MDEQMVSKTGLVMVGEYTTFECERKSGRKLASKQNKGQTKQMERRYSHIQIEKEKEALHYTLHYTTLHYTPLHCLLFNGDDLPEPPSSFHFGFASPCLHPLLRH